MAIEGGLVVGYVVATLLGAGKRWADRRVDSLLDQLTQRVTSRIGRRPIDRLNRDPYDAASQRELGLTIDGAISRDREFDRDLSRLIAELDKRGGRQLVNQVYSQYNMQAFDNGIVIGGDFNYFHAADPTDLSGAPLWVKVCIGLGSAIAVAGMLLFGITLFSDMPDLGDPNFSDIPEGIPRAFGVFFAGFVLLGIGSMGRSFSKRR